MPLDELFRALAHPARRTLLSACADRPRAAGDLAAMIDLAPASVSEHLKVLRKSGLLVLDKRGRFWMYRTNGAALSEAAAALEKLS
jgi:DNA-binding transcriptional ArsR family regulator